MHWKEEETIISTSHMFMRYVHEMLPDGKGIELVLWKQIASLTFGKSDGAMIRRGQQQKWCIWLRLKMAEKQ